MKMRWVVVLVAAFGVIACDPALARARHKPKPYCLSQPLEFSWHGFWFNPHPRPNGCSPPVYVGGEFVGQDPDRDIRAGLKRDPATGYAYDFSQ